MFSSIRKYQQYLWYTIFFISLTGMLGSLYYSNYGDPVYNFMAGNLFPFDGGFVPCLFCWYARIFLYPMVAISAVGILKGDAHFTDYIFPLALLGVLLEGYQYYLQMFASSELAACGAGPSCTKIYVQYFGFVTIPLMGFVAFLIVTGICILNWRCNRLASVASDK